MDFNFFKYNSNGNDFIIIDETKNSYNFSKEIIKKICSRQFGIGADGLVLLQKSEKADFKMKIYNNDGLEANMCGNALLCIVKFIYDSIVKKSKFLIETKSSIYETFVENKSVSFRSSFPKIVSENNQIILESLKNLNFPVIDSGVLHGVIFFEKIDNLDVFNLGKKIRYSKCFPEGINVNFCEMINDKEIKIRTYEKGVEDETYCCSTGALAVAWEIYRKKNIKNTLTFHFKAGNVVVSIDKNGLKLNNKPNFAFKGSTNFFD